MWPDAPAHRKLYCQSDQGDQPLVRILEADCKVDESLLAGDILDAQLKALHDLKGRRIEAQESWEESGMRQTLVDKQNTGQCCVVQLYGAEDLWHGACIEAGQPRLAAPLVLLQGSHVCCDRVAAQIVGHLKEWRQMSKLAPRSGRLVANAKIRTFMASRACCGCMQRANSCPAAPRLSLIA